MFLNNCKTWKRKNKANKTWVNLKTYFSLAHREFCETHTTTASSGFSAAKSAKSLLSYQPNAVYRQETAEAISNLVSATSHYHKSVATLTATVATLSTKLATTNSKLIKAFVETTNLTATVGYLRRMTPKPRGSGRYY